MESYLSGQHKRRQCFSCIHIQTQLNTRFLLQDLSPAIHVWMEFWLMCECLYISPVFVKPWFVISGQHLTPCMFFCRFSSRCCSLLLLHRLLRPLRTLCYSYLRRPPSDQESGHWINIKIFFPGIRLGNILPSNAALARARARQGINY